MTTTKNITTRKIVQTNENIMDLRSWKELEPRKSWRKYKFCCVLYFCWLITRPNWARKVRQLIIDMEHNNNRRYGKKVFCIPENMRKYLKRKIYFCRGEEKRTPKRRKICGKGNMWKKRRKAGKEEAEKTWRRKNWRGMDGRAGSEGSKRSSWTSGCQLPQRNRPTDQSKKPSQFPFIPRFKNQDMLKLLTRCWQHFV